MAGGSRLGRVPGRDQAGRGAAAAAAEGTRQIVTFPVGKEEFGLDIGAITEAIRPLPVTALPHMPPFIEGVINLRERIIPIVDLRKRFGIAGTRSDPRKSRMIITRGALPRRSGGGERLLGLVVDGVRDVMQISRAQVEQAPEAATGQGAEFIAGVAKTRSGLVILLDITRILSREERAALAEAEHGHP